MQPLTALAIGGLLWMGSSIVARMLRRHGLLPPADQVHLQPSVQPFPPCSALFQKAHLT